MNEEPNIPETRRSQIEAAVRAVVKHGTLKPEDVIKAAKPAHSALHNLFTWNDAKAAHERRLEQARRVIRWVRIPITTTSSIIVVPEYVHNPEAGPDESEYVSVESLRHAPENAFKVMHAEVERALGCIVRAEGLAAVLGLDHEVAVAKAKVLKLKKAVLSHATA